ncbi:MAG: glucosamine-6-phosphate deaminase [Actinoplanes sp.]
MRVETYASRVETGRAAAAAVAEELRHRLAGQDDVRMVFAAAPSQREMLDALAAEPGVDWRRVTAFHMDEYLGLPPDAPQRFGAWLREALFDRVPLRPHFITGPPGHAEHTAPPGHTETTGLAGHAENTAPAGYAELLAAAPIDLVCLGIGDNGHIAFNDPPVADFADPAAVKVVQLDQACRQQQVDDECFATLDEVPHRAITLTVPRLLAADRLFCVAPGPRKAEAVRRTLHDPISEACPATALRRHPDCTLFLDAESAALLPR